MIKKDGYLGCKVSKELENKITRIARVENVFKSDILEFLAKEFIRNETLQQKFKESQA